MTKHPFCYILVGKIPIPVKSIDEWMVWLAKQPTFTTRVDLTNIGPIMISTVFLGLDHSWGYGPPMLFETMVFRGGESAECGRYESWEEAAKGHKAFVAKIRNEIKENVNR